jgi:large conductance mechanosensitive channel
MIKGFKEFLLKNNVLALALAVIVGGAVGKVVTSLAQDIIMPAVNPLLPGKEWRDATLTIGKVALKWGSFTSAVIDFLIIAFIVYLITKALVGEKPPEPAPPTKTCPRCKEQVAVDASRCKWCTSDLGAASYS